MTFDPWRDTNAEIDKKLDDAAKKIGAAIAKPINEAIAEAKDIAVAEVRKEAFLEAAGIVEDARNADIELCDMLTEQIRAKAAEQ